MEGHYRVIVVIIFTYKLPAWPPLYDKQHDKLQQHLENRRGTTFPVLFTEFLKYLRMNSLYNDYPSLKGQIIRVHFIST